MISFSVWQDYFVCIEVSAAMFERKVACRAALLRMPQRIEAAAGPGSWTQGCCEKGRKEEALGRYACRVQIRAGRQGNARTEHGYVHLEATRCRRIAQTRRRADFFSAYRRILVSQSGKAARDIVPAVLKRIGELQSRERPLLISIDGRSTAGKTTLAAAISECIDCNVVHMDQFYLKPSQRTSERYAEPGGNVDYERVKEEVIDPLLAGEEFSYRPYDAHRDVFGEELHFDPKPVVLIEGSYSGHPMLWDAYDMHIFMTTSKERQLERVRKRNGEAALEMFQAKWIPLEEKYFKAYSIPERSDMRIET